MTIPTNKSSPVSPLVMGILNPSTGSGQVKNILVMGVLNVTPDSFYDGGHFNKTDAAIMRAEKMIEEGATIIDIGGESTGPGSMEVSEEEERKRTINIVSHVSRLTSHVSIDTTKSSVARAAIDAGATTVNDVSAGRHDPKVFPLIAEKQCNIILMYSKNASPRTTVREQQYDDVMATVKTFLADRITAAESSGISRDRIIVDPGLGHFISSNPRYSWEILERLGELADLDCPILVSPSRKSFTADHLGDPPKHRLPGTLRATELAIRNGAAIIRTHDIKETVALAHPQPRP